MKTVIAIGEPLIEFTQSDADADIYRRGLGGDTLNTAVYLARLIGPGAISYMTRLGKDTQSRWIIETLSQNGVGCGLLRQSETGAPGISMIECDATGERSFTYWRSQSPARQMFALDDGEDLALDKAEGLFVSAVTLAIIEPAGRERLYNALKRARARGADIWLDLNYRPQLWNSTTVARETIARFITLASTVLPSFDDVAALWDADTPEAGLEVLSSLGATEIILKTGGGPVYHRDAHGTLKVPMLRNERPVDTTGAGDSFNAGYIAARLSGKPVSEAIELGHELASVVILHKGAIIPRAAMPAMSEESEAV
ncbi:sugar kinase [Ruegeria profundi]|uniref:sugar kinase n=1 Tax=Ruegeria profundi TaxID=1685378 RepID=UPI001CD4090E|nr:sugar kinase [Ruegeria profundi]MCA0928243.1 sugar kinase [Ruegeria profundi]